MNPLVTGTSWYRAWHRLSRQERRHVVRAAAATSIVAASLRVIGVGRTMAWTQRRTGGPSCAHEAATVDALARALMRTERHSPLPGTCLSRSLALQLLLARRGITSSLRLGGRLVDGRLEAHAWVEYAGAVVGSPPDLATRFTTFAPVPSASPPGMVPPAAQP